MSTKKCSFCKKYLDLEDFHKNHKTKDGLQYICKKCASIKFRIYSEKNKEKIRDTRRKYRIKNRDMIKFYNKKHHDKNKKNRILKNREWKKKNKEKAHAHDCLNHAVRDGKILKPNKCEKCGRKVKISGHHEDYTKPLDVIWVCYSCHSIIHNAVGDKNKLFKSNMDESWDH